VECSELDLCESEKQKHFEDDTLAWLSIIKS
jgi:hypothetical protein